MDIELTIQTQQDGSVAVKRLPLNASLTLGRGPESPVVLDGTGLSREHIVFEPTPTGVNIADLSANGTWINGQRLQQGVRYVATEADRIAIPGYEFRFLLLDVPKPPAAAASPGGAAGTPATKVQVQQDQRSSPMLSSVTRMEWLTAILVLAAVSLILIFLKM